MPIRSSVGMESQSVINISPASAFNEIDDVIVSHTPLRCSTEGGEIHGSSTLVVIVLKVLVHSMPDIIVLHDTGFVARVDDEGFVELDGDLFPVGLRGEIVVPVSALGAVKHEIDKTIGNSGVEYDDVVYNSVPSGRGSSGPGPAEGRILLIAEIRSLSGERDSTPLPGCAVVCLNLDAFFDATPINFGLSSGCLKWGRAFGCASSCDPGHDVHSVTIELGWVGAVIRCAIFISGLDICYTNHVVLFLRGRDVHNLAARHWTASRVAASRCGVATACSTKPLSGDPAGIGTSATF